MVELTEQDHLPLANLIRQLSAEGYETFIFADTFHPYIGVRQAIGSPNVMQALAESGVSTITIEGSPSLQEDIQSYITANTEGRERIAAGLKTPYHANDPEASRQWMHAYLDQFAHASEAGLTASLPRDSRFESLESLREENAVVDAIRAREAGVRTDPLCYSMQVKAFEASLSAEERAALDAHNKKFMSIASNKDANTEITSGTASTELPAGKHAYVYGMEHINGNADLDELSPRAVVIAMADRPGSEILLNSFIHGNKDIPDYAYYTQEQRVTPLDNGAARVEFFMGAPGVKEFALSDERKAACLASIAHLTPHQEAEDGALSPSPTPQEVRTDAAGQQR